MSSSLLETKFYPPNPRSDRVPRLRLLEKLNAGLDNRLTLISAPAGFGKTTLVTEWLSQVKCPFAWVSLDKDDNNVIQFFTYATTAVERIEGVGRTTRRLLQSSQTIEIKSIVTAFINDCILGSNQFILALDDYHVITDKSVNEAVALLLDNMPANFHLVITSRVDPLLPISRLRAHGQMIELRSDDLRFNPEESDNLLKDLMRLNLTAEQTSALENRTEGWVAGLQMAGLSIQGLKSQERIAEVSI